jgi:hypothetical protein
MTKRILSILIVVALIGGAMFSAPAKSRASSGSVTATPNTVAAPNVNVAIALYATISTTNYLIVFPGGFTVPGSISPSAITINGVAPTSATVSGNQVTLVGSGTVGLGNYAIVFSPACGITNPSVGGSYTFTIGLFGGGGSSEYLSPAATIGGGGSGSLALTPSSTTAGATNVTLNVGFTPTYSVSSMTLYLTGYTFLGTPSLGNVYITGGSGSLAAVSGSGSTLTLTFSPALVAYSTYTLYITSGCGLLNPATANTYTITASLSGGGSQTLTGTVTIGGGSVTIQSISVSPLTPSTVAQFSISFYTSSSATGIKNGDTIRVEFPAGTQFPSSSFCPACFVINGQPAQIAPTRVNNVVTITVPTTLPTAAQYVYLTIGTTAGIINPSTSGNYSLKVSTSLDTTQVTSNQYTLVGTSISSLAVTANPTAQSAYPELRFTFTTSSSGGLSQSDYIYIQFPTAMTMPSSVPAASVTVNGAQVSSISLDGSDKLSIRMPTSVGNSQQVSVIIAATSGISSPSTVGTTLSFTVSTSEDVGTQSVSYTTTTSQVSQPQVSLTTNGVGKPSGYTVTFQTGAGGLLSAGIGRIDVVFPNGTTVPASISAQSVRVNNVLASYVTASAGNRRVEITTPVAVPANSQVTVVLDVAANIVNPLTPATSYTLAVYTSTEQTLVYSTPYSIVNLPTSTAVTTPAGPDGLNGYYRTRPTVTITASSPSGYPVSIYYHINTGAETLYNGPVQIPDGIVTLTYYAKDSQNNQELARQLTFKVDATPPVVTILSPLEGAVTSTGALSITGRTEAGASVSINGASVAVQPSGEFSGSVTLSEGANAIQIVATDLAGNVGQTRVNVTLDTKPPVLTMTSPKIYSTVMTQQVAVTGKTEAGATVTVAGSQVNVAADGSFSIMYMFPKEGLNVVDVTSTDAAGNVAKTGIPVTYVARTLIRLQVGNKTAMINDTTKTLQAAPVNVKGTVMVPIRFIGEAFGATVEWEPVFKIVRLQLGSTTIYLQMGYNYASVNGKKIVLQGLPSIIKGTTMVPIRFISEAFNAQVTWIAATQGVEITYPKP